MKQRLGSDPLSWIRDTRTSQEDTNTGERDAASARPADAAPAASTNDANTGEQSARPAARPARRKPASTKKTNTGERAAAPAAPVAPAAPAAPHSDANTGELPGEEALRALIARELAGLTPRRGRPRTNLREVTSSSQEGLPENWTRATFIVRQTLLEDLKDCAYTQRRTIRDVLDEALRAYLSGQELLRRPR